MMSGVRQRPNFKGTNWPRNTAACYIFLSRGCSGHENTPAVPSRELTDEENAARVVITEILKSSPPTPKNPKVAFMFLTPGPLPFEMLWDKFFQLLRGGKNGRIGSASERVKVMRVDLVFMCMPQENSRLIYDDPGPHGAGGRYSEHMLPEIEFKDFRKGSQWFTMTRKHALIIMADSLYYRKFRLYCRPGFEGRNCYADEHYFQTLFYMIDPAGIANWSVTYVDWSERKWHPRSYKPQDITPKLLRNLTSFDTSQHFTSDEKKTVLTTHCMWNGMKRPCFLFARKFYPETLDNLLQLFSNSTSIPL
ncbi:hypothetical protein M8C21_032331 [Ambrosia artemisiifolia]|uniref:Core-2/I-branching beta-16-N-acetylglucosaminyltransferase family protein n=1 Tax=Ambrosia artemisiifolia TaxID=4212 RepID=A0AAD5GBZ1_AMBAR|nr:hypothetical protein M8C21_032331 [Ambrosia artemisiifolia]